MNERSTSDPVAAASAVSPADFLAPPSIPHYEPGPETTRMVERNAVLWAVTYHAQHDGIGWLVQRCSCAPVEGSQRFFKGGDVLYIRVKAGLDFGPVVEVIIDSPDGARHQRVHRSSIMRVETYASPPQTVSKPPAS